MLWMPSNRPELAKRLCPLETTETMSIELKVKYKGWWNSRTGTN